MYIDDEPALPEKWYGLSQHNRLKALLIVSWRYKGTDICSGTLYWLLLGVGTISCSDTFLYFLSSLIGNTIEIWVHVVHELSQGDIVMTLSLYSGDGEMMGFVTGVVMLLATSRREVSSSLYTSSCDYLAGVPVSFVDPTRELRPKYEIRLFDDICRIRCC